MLARSQMGGPWSRAKRVAHASQDVGHEVTLAWGDDGNCADPIAPTLEIPVPSPLGLPEAIARHTFLLASRLGLMGRKPVRSFEEVLWLTGALDERYTRAAVDTLRAHMRASRPDVVYSEFSLAAVIAARAEVDEGAISGPAREGWRFIQEATVDGPLPRPRFQGRTA